MENVPMTYRLRASIQRALLGEVDARMVAVTCGVAGSTIRVRSYVDGPVTPKDIDRIQMVASEVHADFMDEGYTIEEECLPLGPVKPVCLDFFAFYRADKPVP
jgi:hypothetical protein